MSIIANRILLTAIALTIALSACKRRSVDGSSNVLNIKKVEDPPAACPTSEADALEAHSLLVQRVVQALGRLGLPDVKRSLVTLIRGRYAGFFERCMEANLAFGFPEKAQLGVKQLLQHAAGDDVELRELFSIKVSYADYLKIAQANAKIPQDVMTPTMIKALTSGDLLKVKNLIDELNAGRTDDEKIRVASFKSQLGSGDPLMSRRLSFYVPQQAKRIYMQVSMSDIGVGSDMSVIGTEGYGTDAKVWFRDTRLSSEGIILEPRVPISSNDCTNCHVGRQPMAIHPQEILEAEFPQSKLDMEIINQSVLDIIVGFTPEVNGYLVPEEISFGIDKNSSASISKKAGELDLLEEATCSKAGCHDGGTRPIMRGNSFLPTKFVQLGLMPPMFKSPERREALLDLLRDDYTNKVCRFLGGCSEPNDK